MHSPATDPIVNDCSKSGQQKPKPKGAVIFYPNASGPTFIDTQGCSVVPDTPKKKGKHHSVYSIDSNYVTTLDPYLKFMQQRQKPEEDVTVNPKAPAPTNIDTQGCSVTTEPIKVEVEETGEETKPSSPQDNLLSNTRQLFSKINNVVKNTGSKSLQWVKDKRKERHKRKVSTSMVLKGIAVRLVWIFSKH